MPTEASPGFVTSRATWTGTVGSPARERSVAAPSSPSETAAASAAPPAQTMRSTGP